MYDLLRFPCVGNFYLLVLFKNNYDFKLATISPSESNSTLTLSTLRYADRAKKIKCYAIINEDPKDKIITELQNEIVKLKMLMKNEPMMKSQHLDLSQNGL